MIISPVFDFQKLLKENTQIQEKDGAGSVCNQSHG